MFTGEYEHTVDDKGRIFLPMRYRDALGSMIYLGRGLDGQINIYPQPYWEELIRRVEQAPEDEDMGSVRQTSRFLFATEACEVDRQGRVIIPALLREYADLESQVVILGHRDRMEIWNKQQWREMCRQTRQQNQGRIDDPKQMARLKLNL